MQPIKPSVGVTPEENKKVLGRYEVTIDNEDIDHPYNYQIVFWDGGDWRRDTGFICPPPESYVYLEPAFETYSDINDN